jgi:hypothetical protein
MVNKMLTKYDKEILEIVKEQIAATAKTRGKKFALDMQIA